MTPEEYATLGESIQATIVDKIRSVVNAATVNLSKVLDRDPVNLDEADWLGALRSDVDVDENGEKRAHAWVVTFAASDDLESDRTQSIQPTFRYRVQVFYTHDFGTDADNSEKRIRAEVLKVQIELAKMARPAKTNNYGLLPIRLRLMRFPSEIVHKGEGELTFALQAISTR